MNNLDQITYEDRIKYFYDDNPYKDHPDIYELFRFYNQFFFNNSLNSSFIKWSNRMTLCAGTCSYQGMNSCTITLSEPLLKFRSSNELKETLIHEMIHAYFFITDPESCKINEGHGPNFLDMMNKINRLSKLNVSVYHKFHDEVDRCREHIWKCDGICQQKPPFFGIVKRSMNRPPQQADNWFSRHESECGGQFHKISAPQAKQNKQLNKPKTTDIKRQKKQKVQIQPQITTYINNINNKILEIFVKQEKFSLKLLLQLQKDLQMEVFYQFYSRLKQFLYDCNEDLKINSIDPPNSNITIDQQQLKKLFKFDNNISFVYKTSNEDIQVKGQTIILKKLEITASFDIIIEKSILLTLNDI